MLKKFRLKLSTQNTNEVRKDKNYRQNSWNLLFLLFLNEKKKINFNKLNAFEKQQYYLYLVKEEIEKDNLERALVFLNSIKNYTLFPENEKKVFLLKSQIYLLQNQKELASNYLVKLLYSSLSQEAEIALIFKVVEILLELEWNEEAKSIFTKIKRENLPERFLNQYEEIVSLLSS